MELQGHQGQQEQVALQVQQERVEQQVLKFHFFFKTIVTNLIFKEQLERLEFKVCAHIHIHTTV